MTCVYAQAYSSLSLFLFQTSLPPSSPHASTTAHIRVGGDGANRPRSPFLPVARSCLLHPFWLGESLGLCWGGKNFKRNRRHRRPAASARALRFSPPSLSLSLYSPHPKPFCLHTCATTSPPLGRRDWEEDSSDGTCVVDKPWLIISRHFGQSLVRQWAKRYAGCIFSSSFGLPALVARWA